MNGCNNVKNFWNNKSSKSNGNYSYKRFLEKFKTQYHDDNSLIDTDPYPNKESFCI